MKVKTAKYEVGDVVVTIRSIRLTGPNGKTTCHALPGWKWKIESVKADCVEVLYDCVALEAPNMYSCTLKEKQIFGKLAKPTLPT